MDKVLEFAFRQFLDGNGAGGDLCGKIDDLFQPLCDRLKELVSDKDYMELETELIDAYIKAEVLAGVEGMKLMQGLVNGSIEKIA